MGRIVGDFLLLAWRTWDRISVRRLMLLRNRRIGWVRRRVRALSRRLRGLRLVRRVRMMLLDYAGAWMLEVLWRWEALRRGVGVMLAHDTLATTSDG